MEYDRDKARSEPLASARHLAALCLILLGIAAAGFVLLARAHGPEGSTSGPSGASLYLPLLAAEWGLFLYVRAGLRGSRHSVRELISARPMIGPALFADVVLGALLFGTVIATGFLFERWFGAGTPGSVQTLLVRRGWDIPLWILLSLSAGFVEELTFRGYLQVQFGALLNSRWLGVAAQAILFGVTHGYQGATLVLRIAMLGLIFGILALLRRSLVPGMIAHAAMDVAGGLAAFR